MARFYKTATPTFSANMVANVPAELMLGALQTHEKKLQEAEKEGDVLRDVLGTLNNLDDDNELVNAEKQRYRDKIAELQDKVIQDPANYLKYTGEIRNLSRDLSKNLDNGIFKRASENFEQKAIRDKEFDSSGADQDTINNAKKYYAQKYSEQGGLGFKDENNFNRYAPEVESLFKANDENKLINEFLTSFKPDTSAYASSSPDGRGYIRTRNGTTTKITEKEVDQWMDDYAVNSNWKDATRQQVFFDFAANRGFKGGKDDPLIEQEVERRWEAFKDMAKNKMASKQETKNASTTGDAYAQRLLTEARNNSVLSRADKVNHQTPVEAKFVSNQNIKIFNSPQMQAAGITTEDALFKRMTKFAGNPAGATKFLLGLKDSNGDSVFKDFNEVSSYLSAQRKNYVVETEEFKPLEEIMRDNPKLSELEAKALYNKINGQDGQIAKSLKTVDTSRKNDNIIVTYPGGKVEHLKDISYLDLIESGKLTTNAAGAQLSAASIEVPKKVGSAYMVNGVMAVDANSNPLTLSQIENSGQKVDTETKKNL